MSEISNTRPSFFLRWDFALEIGFVDFLRKPVSVAEYAAVLNKGGTEAFSWRSYEDYNRARASTPLPRYVMASAMIEPGDLTGIPSLYDGRTWYSPEKSCGLFAELVARVGIVAPPEAGRSSQIYPNPLSAPRDRWRAAKCAVIHDSATSIATVWPWSEARTAIEAWAKVA